MSKKTYKTTEDIIEKLKSQIEILEAKLKYEFDVNKNRKLRTLKRRLKTKKNFIRR